MNHDNAYQQNKPHKHNKGRKQQVTNVYQQNNSNYMVFKTDPIRQYIAQGYTLRQWY